MFVSLFYSEIIVLISFFYSAMYFRLETVNKLHPHNIAKN